VNGYECKGAAPNLYSRTSSQTLKKPCIYQRISFSKFCSFTHGPKTTKNYAFLQGPGGPRVYTLASLRQGFAGHSGSDRRALDVNFLSSPSSSSPSITSLQTSQHNGIYTSSWLLSTEAISQCSSIYNENRGLQWHALILVVQDTGELSVGLIAARVSVEASSDNHA
jgi:hypothetical protein